MSSAVSLLVLGIVLELGLRWFGPFLPGSYRTGPLIEPDPDVGWRQIPSTVIWFRNQEFTVQVRTNSAGRFGPEAAEEPRRGAPRVILLGDSFVGATQMRYESTMAGLLPSLLADAGDVEVVNEGSSGYGTDQEILVLERRDARLRPDVVVLVFTVANDAWNNLWELESKHTTYAKPYFEVDPQGELVLRPPIAPSVGVTDGLRSILSRSVLLTVVKTGLIDPLTLAREQLYRLDQLGVLEQPAGAWERAWQVTSLLIVRFARDARAMGAKPLLVIAPDPCQVHADLCSGRAALSDSTVPQDRLRDAAGRAGVPVLDLLPAFRREAASGRRLYFARDLHWTADGQELAAREVARELAPLVRTSAR